jgi:hypothetical protein
LGGCGGVGGGRVGGDNSKQNEQAIIIILHILHYNTSSALFIIKVQLDKLLNHSSNNIMVNKVNVDFLAI